MTNNHQSVNTIANFQHICRTCALEGEMNSLFSYKQFSDYSLRIVDILMEIANIQVDEGDELPGNMCSKCLLQLDSAYLFKLQCEQTNAKLHACVGGVEAKPRLNECAIKAERVPLSDCGDGGKAAVAVPSPVHKIKFRKKVKRPTKSCEICDKSVSSSFYPKHMRIHTGERPHKCHVCGKGFIQKGTLAEHLRVHTGEKPYVCPVCGHSFGKSWNLMLHMKRHGEAEDVAVKGAARKTLEKVVVTCDVCKQQFGSKVSLRKHSVSHKEKTYSCGECGKRFASNERLQTHRRLHSGERPFACPVCGKRFITLMYMKYHKQTHKAKMFLCNHCGKGFVRKAALQVHLRVHTGEKPYACAACGKAFKQVGTLRAHEMVHSDERPYPCQYCAKAFRHITHLENHKRTHTGEKPFVCVVCGKCFAVKVNLTVHMRMHSGETPYKCPVCAKGFYDSSSMKKHHKGHANAAT